MMARGKYASSADARRAREGAISEAESLRRQLAKMTKENIELHQDINGLLGSHNAEMLRMRNAAAKGETPMVLSRDKVIAEMRAELADIRKTNTKIVSVQEKLTLAAVAHFKTEHKMIGADALQEIMDTWLGVSSYIHDGPTNNLTIKGMERIDVVRGNRSKSSIDRLNSTLS